MSIANRLYDRPDLGQKFGKLALYISGAFDKAKPDIGYESRIQINNPIGDCWVELINGTLPPGYALAVDNATHEVVLSWPGYSEAAVVVLNGDFELDDTSWQRGAGWAIEVKGARPTDTSGTKAAAYRGSGESFMEATTFYPLTGTQTTITFNLRVQQGGSSKNNVVASSALRYYDASKKLIHTDSGNVVSSGSDGEWQNSGDTSGIPATAALVRPAIWGKRKRQNKVLYADDFTWNLAGVSIGIHEETTLVITVRVHDAGGRIADSDQTIDVSNSPTDPYWANVVALLQADGANGSTAVLDKTGRAWTAYGAAAVDTSLAPFAGTNSFKFTSNTARVDYLLTDSTSPDFALGTGDFTVECFAQQSSLSAFVDYQAIVHPNSLITSVRLHARRFGAEVNYYFVYDNGVVAQSPNENTLDTWVHVAWVRASGVDKIYVKGVGYGSHTSGINYSSAGKCGVGWSTGGNGFIGNLAQIRITKGIARYTADFDPPTEPFPIEGP